MAEKNEMYWVLNAGGNPNAMLLDSLPVPEPFVEWMDGERFASPLAIPVIATIKPGYEHSDLPVFKEVPQVMTVEFLAALQLAGVDNIDTYDAVLQSQDGSVRMEGYKAYNIIGCCRVADLEKTEFANENPSRSVDASIRSLVIDPSKTKGALMFRLEESVDTILIHDSVKQILEARHFKGVKFVRPNLHIS